MTAIARIILYVKDIPKTALFYQKHFGMRPLPTEFKGWLELSGEAGSCSIALHQAAVSQKSGSAVKIVFGVKDVAKFKRESEAQGLKFGVIHKVGEFEFSSAKDPAGNSIQISRLTGPSLAVRRAVP